MLTQPNNRKTLESIVPRVTTTRPRKPIPPKAIESYMVLVREFPLSSIESDEHLEAAQQVMDQLLVKEILNRGEETYLNALSDLVKVYEDEHHSIPPASDADMLRHLMESKGVTAAQLSNDTAIAKSSLSEILAGKKPFSRPILRKLSEYFGVEVSVLTANW